MERKSVARVLIFRLIGLIFFFILLYFANILMVFIPDRIFHSIVFFFNSNVAIIASFSIIFLIAEVFRVLEFPLNLPYPIFSAFGCVFLVKFLFRMLLLADNFIQQEIFAPLSLLSPVAYPLIFLIVLIAGYIKILKQLIPKEERKEIKTAKMKKLNLKGKVLMRSRKNRILAGVCGGIGEYLEIDPTVIRLLWTLFSFLSMGAGVFAYILAWIIIPEKK